MVEFVRLRTKGRVKRFVQQKAEGTFGRYPRLEGIRINVKQDTENSGNPSYIAQTRLVFPGYDRIIEKRRNAVIEAVAEAFEVADRNLLKDEMEFLMPASHFTVYTRRKWEKLGPL